MDWIDLAQDIVVLKMFLVFMDVLCQWLLCADSTLGCIKSKIRVGTLSPLSLVSNYLSLLFSDSLPDFNTRVRIDLSVNGTIFGQVLPCSYSCFFFVKARNDVFTLTYAA